MSKDVVLGPEVASKLTPLKVGKLSQLPRVDRVLLALLDVSASMGERLKHDWGHQGRTSKLSVAFHSLNDVMAKNLAGCHLGVLLFGTDEGDGVTWLVLPSDKVDMGKMHEPEPQDSTPLLPALKMASGWLSRRAETARMVLITDGMPNQGGHQPEVLAWAEENHRVPIDCIGVGGHGFDPEFLQRLASITGGVYCEASDTAALLDVILRLSPAQRPLLGPCQQKGQAENAQRGV